MSYYAQAKAMVALAKRRLQIAGAYHTIYGTPEGEQVIHDILREAGVLSVSHVMGDPGTSQFNSGKQAVGLFILKRLRFSAGELVKLAQMQTGEELNEEG